jgi:N-acetyl-anhydromuramyl-L-alanine amidase AmpD
MYWHMYGPGVTFTHFFETSVRPAPVNKPPPEWRATARPNDVLMISGLEVAYWGRKDREYGIGATRAAQPFEGIVVHYTEDRPALAFVEYQHNGDSKRGGAFGYHFYCDKWGRAFQGAPLSKRTNHIKHEGHKNRTKRGRHLSSSNAVGVSMVGGCYRTPGKKPITASCDGERITAAQQNCGLAIIRALQAEYDIPRHAVYGHGDLQTDRSSFEGSTLTKIIRSEADAAK